MKVLFIINSLKVAGAEKMAVNLAIGMKKSGVSTFLCYVRNSTETNEAELKKSLNEAEIPIFSLRKAENSKSRGVFRSLNILKKNIEKIQPDIIHSHCELPDILSALVKDRSLKLRTLHSEQFHQSNKILGILISWLIGSRFHFNIAVSGSVMKKYIKLYGIKKNRIRVISNGIPDIFYQKSKSRECFSNPIRLGMVGRLSYAKGHRQALDIIAEVEENNLDYNFFIAGDGELKEEIQMKVKSRKLKNVYFLGHLTEPELIKLYQDLDVLLMPSVFEGSPLVAIEAMAMGLPVLANNVAGLRDLVEDGGIILFNPGSVREYYITLAELKNQPAYYQKLSLAAIKNSKRFKNENMIMEYMDIYKKLFAI